MHEALDLKLSISKNKEIKKKRLTEAFTVMFDHISEHCDTAKVTHVISYPMHKFPYHIR